MKEKKKDFSVNFKILKSSDVVSIKQIGLNSIKMATKMIHKEKFIKNKLDIIDQMETSKRK